MAKEAFKIDRGVPLPAGKARGYQRQYPFDKMKVGDSFFVATKEQKAKQTNLLNAAAHFRNYARTAAGKLFRIKTGLETGGIRVWRIA